jgi:hypothetical protein
VAQLHLLHNQMCLWQQCPCTSMVVVVVVLLLLRLTQ